MAIRNIAGERVMESKSRYSIRYFVSANEGNAQHHLATPILVSNIIDVATAHANSLHIGNPDMEHIYGGWVLSRLTIEMERWPDVDTFYTLQTWIYSFNRHFSERNFAIVDDNGSVMGYARSIWMVIDTKDHHNLGLSHFSLDESLIDGAEIPIARQQRHVPIVTVTDDMPPKSLKATAPVRQYTFQYCDIDFYRHVNTVRYVVLLLNQFTLQQMDATPLKRLELSFMHEAEYGMTVDIMRSDNQNDTSTFTLCRAGEHTAPLLFARIGLMKG